jgi:YebC/PmpR family DNA-binding regulatory protein
MGKGWKNPIKAANAAKKGLRFSKLAKEIQVAAKLGGADIEMNARLRMAVDAAKAESCPKDTIDRAIKKGAGLLDGEAQPEEVLYEGFGPSQVGILVECQTDNRARTATDIKVIFNKNNGQMAESGSVSWMFDRVGLVEGFNTNQDLDIEEEAIEAGASDVEPLDSEAGLGASFYTAPEELDIVRKELVDRGWTIEVMELSYKAKTITEISDEEKEQLSELLEKLDDNDDSYRVYSSAEF